MFFWTVVSQSRSNAATAFSVVSLAAPCPQTDTEILQITYRISLDQSIAETYSDLGDYILEQQFRRTFIPIVNNGDNQITTPNQIYVVNWDSTLRDFGGISYRTPGQVLSTSTTSEIYSSGGLGKSTWDGGAIHQGAMTCRIIGQFGESNSPTASQYRHQLHKYLHHLTLLVELLLH